jgi:hypothetical protein
LVGSSIPTSIASWRLSRIACPISATISSVVA